MRQFLADLVDVLTPKLQCRTGDPRFSCFRVFWLGRRLHRVAVDCTITRFYAGKPAYVRLQVFSARFEANKEYSGLPK
jgi:hypothetical protein